MTGRRNGWRSLTWSERGQLLLVTAALQLIHAALGLFGYQRTHKWLKRHSRHAAVRAASPADLRMANRLVHLAAIAGRHGPISATCLRQSLLLYWLLRRRGLQPCLRLGVRKQAEALDAHAWVELEGQPLSRTPIQHQAFTLPDREP